MLRWDADDFGEAPAKEEFTLSQPHNAKASLFPDCTTRNADYEAVFDTDPEFANGCYKTSFRITSFGGFCGVDSLRVRFRGGLLGYVPINVRSPDMVSGASRAKVSLADLSKFGGYYPSPPKDYEPLADFVSPSGVGLGDFTLFIYHYANGGHEYTPPSVVVGDGGQTTEGNASLVVSQGPAFEGNRTLLASVQLDASASYEVALLAFRCNNSRLTLIDWEEAEGYAGATIGAQAVVGDDHVLAIGLFGNRTISGASVIGTATFRVEGQDSLVLDDEDFEPVIADILLSNGVEGMLSTSSTVALLPRLKNSLRQNFPNPFNPQTTITYSLKDATNVRLTIYDVGGRRVRELVDGKKLPGVYRATWDGTDSAGRRVASGVYFYKLKTNSFSAAKKMVLLN